VTSTRGLILTVLIALSLIVLFTPEKLSAQARTVTRVAAVARPRTYSGPCPAEIRFTGTIFVSRRPVFVDYRWERSDGAMGPRQQIEIRSAGQGVVDTWRIGRRGERMEVWEKLHVLAPTGISSPAAIAKLVCR